MKKHVYKIKITNWLKYNKDRKKSYRKVMISEKFLDDPKISSLTPCRRLLFLSLLLHCSESTQGEAEVCPEIISRQSGVKPGLIQSSLDQFQSFQLLKYEKIEFLYNRNKEKRNEEKRKENNLHASPPAEKLLPQKPPAEKQISLPAVTSTQSLTAAVQVNPVKIYCDAYKAKYGHSPQIGKKQAGILTNFGKSHGAKTEALIQGYLALPDSFIVQRSHPVELLESKLNEVVRFLKTGKVVTKAHAKEFDEAIEEKLGPKPKGIKEALEEEAELHRRAMEAGNQMTIFKGGGK